MEKTKTDGEDSAFPWIDSLGSESEGLTKREYFAAMVMQGLAASENWTHSAQEAAIAVTAADALIEALNK